MTGNGNLAAELMDTVASLRRLVRRRIRPTMPEPALRGAQIELLNIVDTQPGVGVAAAARALHLADNSVSTLVNQLVNAGLLWRRVDPVDRRAARLELTDAARDRLRHWRTGRDRVVGDALSRLPGEDVRAIEAALPALRRLLREIEEGT
ncbi:MarR family winged helix-turn-helix transcriptional regulator [Planosporangium mesophilum]|uniref:MarR family transcriptional regulator n=1 Tax=Planosporangium mesophilum TaxID=689768 RepID=A0A8J3TH10_9ACTN|nr:MarR family winged helix-turn-helix transcriptional regulator [Planosporangium mesophilum]GII26308.1 MarR family transcriptional regulator [Planosporangium mesophilum]